MIHLLVAMRCRFEQEKSVHKDNSEKTVCPDRVGERRAGLIAATSGFSPPPARGLQRLYGNLFIFIRQWYTRGVLDRGSTETNRDSITFLY
jgi:hypothetical protein